MPEDAPEEPESIPIPAHKRKKGGRRKPPKHLPRERIEHDLADEEKTCQCGACRTKIGEEVSEQYDVLPPKFRVLEQVRFVYACPTCNAAPRTADQSPSAPLPRTPLLDGFSGYLQTDGHAGYNPAATRPAITQLGCWVHVRRKFDAALKSSSPVAVHVAYQGLALIRELYEIDNRAKNKPPDERHCHRQQQVAPQ